MKIQYFSHLLFGLGCLLLFLISPFIQMIDDHEKIYIVLAIVAYTCLFLWSLLVLFSGRRDTLVLIEAVAAFLLGIFMVPALGRSWMYVFGQRTQYDKSWFLDDVFVIYLHLTNLSLLLCSLFCIWRKKKLTKKHS